ncbi:MAG: CPBP family intramembrane glutamic endopeptidase [Oscillochloridaceae bacterium umkhey_bin13]
MNRGRDRNYPTDAFGLPEGLLAAIVGALLLVGAFVLTSAATAMPATERWAALTTISLLAVAVTLPGCAAIYDALGRAVRQDWRAAVTLLALVPALYNAYALAVNEFRLNDALAALFFAGVPAMAFWRAGRSRQPTIFDALALSYLAVSLWIGLLPNLTLPEQGGLVGFLPLASVPLLLLLFAWRGWPGVGYSWHLRGPDLRDALLAALAALAVLVLVTLLTNNRSVGLTPTAGSLISSAITTYFFVAIPTELLLRGGIQNGLARALTPGMGQMGNVFALITTATLWAGLGMLSGGWLGLLKGAMIGLAGGWVYLRSGKTTAAAVTHGLIVWVLSQLGF